LCRAFYRHLREQVAPFVADDFPFFGTEHVLSDSCTDPRVTSWIFLFSPFAPTLSFQRCDLSEFLSRASPIPIGKKFLLMKRCPLNHKTRDARGNRPENIAKVRISTNARSLPYSA